MTKKTLKKLTDKQKGYLESTSNYYKASIENKDFRIMEYWNGKVLGYIDALKDCGLIDPYEVDLLRHYYMDSAERK